MRGKVLPYRRTVLAVGITPAYAGKRLPSLLFLALHWDHPRVCGEKTLLFLKWCSDTGSPPRMRGKVSIASRFVCCFEDHPRVCGEKLNALLVAGSLMGSPPRMRGKGIQPCNQWVRVGITPAYAGKRLCCRVGSRVTGDHPRVCGEKGVPHRGGTRCRGSPPRMRGKGKKGLKKSPRYGITPAYAGKSYGDAAPRSVCGDHPRVCGEKPWRSPAAPGTQGSPPRMRGKAASTASTSLKTGITPAYAGKSLGAARVAGTGQDHPRVCGEKAVAIIWWYSCTGSPPRMRGKEIADLPSGGAALDHPRVCGEKRIRMIQKFLRRGSPPRMRGKAFPFCPRSFCSRITPAYAGKSQSIVVSVLFCRDHPRVCGEKSCALLLLCRRPGSPPRMRGKV